MNGDHPTMGDFAYEDARRALSQNRSLEQRVSVLENDLAAAIDAIEFLAEQLGVER